MQQDDGDRDGPPPDDGVFPDLAAHGRGHGAPPGATEALARGPEIPGGPREVAQVPRRGSPAMARRDAPASADALADLTAEVALLRAELDLLRQSFRRHCSETD